MFKIFIVLSLIYELFTLAKFKSFTWYMNNASNGNYKKFSEEDKFNFIGKVIPLILINFIYLIAIVWLTIKGFPYTYIGLSIILLSAINFGINKIKHYDSIHFIDKIICIILLSITLFYSLDLISLDFLIGVK